MNVVQSKIGIFADVRSMSSFYCGINDAGHHGLCFKLHRAVHIRSRSPALPFLATAVCERGIPLEIDQDEMVTLISETSEADRTLNFIPIIAGYIFVSGSHKDEPVKAYIVSKGQLV